MDELKCWHQELNRRCAALTLPVQELLSILSDNLGPVDEPRTDGQMTQWERFRAASHAAACLQRARGNVLTDVREMIKQLTWDGPGALQPS